jgi:hypothetical protein
MTAEESEGIKIAFESFTEAEQLVFRKNFEMQQKYGDNPPKQVVEENKELIFKFNQIFAHRVSELFLDVMPLALVLDEVEQWYFRFHFSYFLDNFAKCIKKVNQWPEKEREEFMKEMKIGKYKEGCPNGKENNA